MQWSYSSYTAWIARHHRAIVVASALLSLLSALSLVRLRLDIDVLGMLPRGTPPFDDFKSFVADFGRLDELMIVLDEAPPQKLQRFADALAPKLDALDDVTSVHFRVDPQQVLDGMLGTYLFNYIPEPLYAQVAERLTPEAIDAQVAVDRAILSAPFDLSATRAVIDDPLGLRRIAGQHLSDAYAGAAPNLDGGYFSAADGSALLLFVRPTGSPFDNPFTLRLLEQVRAAVAATQQAIGEPSPRVRYAGSYAFAAEDAATIKTDIARYTILALLGVLLVFYIGYGNLRVLPFVTYPLIVNTLITFALGLLATDQLNAVSLSFAAILYGLSIDSGIHFYSRLLDERRRHGDDIAAAVTATLAGLGRPHVAASATTAASFAVIGISSLVAVRELGLLVALGMAVTTLQFFVLYPALGFMLGRQMGTAARRDSDAPRLARWAAAAQRSRRGIRIGMAVAALLLLVAALQVRLDPGLDQLRPADSPALRMQDEIAARFARQERSGAVLVRRPDVESTLVEAERVAALLRDYRDRGLVGSVQSVDAVLPSEQAQRARLARYAALPRREAVERLRDSLRTNGFKPERFAGFLDAFAAPRDGIVRLGDPALQPLEFVIAQHVRVRNDGVIAAVYFDPTNLDDWPAIAARLHADLPELPIAIAARPLLEYELGRVLRWELVLFLIFAFAGNFVLLIVIVRDLRTSLAVLAPVALVVVTMFAGMWLAGVPIDPVNLIVPPLIVGIGVDNGVYFAGVVRELGNVGAAMRAVGRAITLTSLTTIAGFGFLAFSAYPPLAGMGALVGIGLFLCLVSTVVLLPALLPVEPPARTHGVAVPPRSSASSVVLEK